MADEMFGNAALQLVPGTHRLMIQPVIHYDESGIVFDGDDLTEFAECIARYCGEIPRAEETRVL